MASSPTKTSETERDEPLAMRWSPGRVAGVAAMLVMVGFWAWIFAGGPRSTNPDRLDDRAFVERSEARCQQLRDDLDELPNAATITDPTERAEVLDDANVLVTGLVDDLEADAPTEGDDAKSVRGWIADWRTYVDDREAYADELRTDPDARFVVSESPLGDGVDKTIEIFVQVNDMRACATPGDVG